MSLSGNIQTSFLDQIKQRLAPNVSFADELAEVLSLSRDSAYRRIRGETVLSLDEVKTLCNHYGVSLDALLAPSSETVPFHYQVVSYQNFTIEQWLKSIENNLQLFEAFPEKNKELVYYAKDMPVFYYFMLPELAAFKLFFWMKTILGYPEYQHEKFNAELVPKVCLATSSRIWDKYSRIPSTELWSDENLNGTLKQIEYYYDCGFFTDKDQAIHLLDQFALLVKKVRVWSADGSKDGSKGKLRLYKNEILIAENTVLFKMGDKRVIFLTHNITDILSTSHELFCKHTEQFMEILLNKATLISATGEKERNRFFNQLDDKIIQVKERLV